MGCTPSNTRVEPIMADDRQDDSVMPVRNPSPSRFAPGGGGASKPAVAAAGMSPFGGAPSAELSDFQKMMRGSGPGPGAAAAGAGLSPASAEGGSGKGGLPPHMRGNKWRQRRVSVSAESFKVDDATYEKKVVPKSDEAKAHIRSVTEKNFLFSSLDAEQSAEVIDAMFEVLVENGDNVINQGDSGDNFYIVDSGEFDIFVKGPGKVAHVERGGSFGELALMYNTPRAATVTAITDDCKLWAVDRSTFRHLLLATASRKRKTYEAFLSEVPILSSLTSWERATIADALKPIVYSDGQTIIAQGEPGDRFFLIERGAAVVTIQGAEAGSEEVEVMQYQKGSYFGELALITKAPRAATVRAVGGTTCVYLDTEAFSRLLGPCEEILKRNLDNYESYEQVLRSPRNKSVEKERAAESVPVPVPVLSEPEAGVVSELPPI